MRKATAVVWLFAFAACPIASAQKIGAWVVDASTTSAYTINDSGNIFGQWCYPSEGSCVYMVGVPTSCEEGSRYPVLINSPASALQTELVCGGKISSMKLYRYTLSSFDQIDRLAREARKIGFAVPLEGDQFKVYRFSLDGAVGTMEVMRRQAEEKREQIESRSTKDKVL